jgi:archaellin
MDKKHTEKGSAGTSTMIIFIALILVSVIAASVIIQTSSSTSSKALDVGRQSEEKVTTSLEILQFFVNGTSDSYINGSIDQFSVLVRTMPGAPSIKLDQVYIKFDTEVESQALTYTLGSIASETTYSAQYALTGNKFKEGYLSTGDVVQFDFFITSGVDLGEDTHGTIRVITNSGAVRMADFHTPLAMIGTVTYLYP